MRVGLTSLPIGPYADCTGYSNYTTYGEVSSWPSTTFIDTVVQCPDREYRCSDSGPGDIPPFGGVVNECIERVKREEAAAATSSDGDSDSSGGGYTPPGG